jgi:nucleotide-binding universal stress UspA family protein
MAASRSRTTIVVGVDGSPSSLEALRWAADQAELTGGELHAVTSWHMPTTYGWIPPVADFDWAGNARTTLEQAIKGAVDEDRAASVRRHVVEGPAPRVLLHAAADADLLVVGSRGYGEFAGMLLGSVAQHVVAHAPCPVLVLRSAAGTRDPPSTLVRTSDRRTAAGSAPPDADPRWHTHIAATDGTEGHD